MKDKVKSAGFVNKKVVCEEEEKKKEKMWFSLSFKCSFRKQCITQVVNNKMRFGLPNKEGAGAVHLTKTKYPAMFPFLDAPGLVLIHSILQAPPWFSGQGQTKICSS